MKTIVAGSRSITSYDVVRRSILESGFEVTEIVSGCARGVDVLGERYACENQIPIKRFPAKWNLHGKVAGFMRNSAMAEYADALVAVWDGKSRGTQHMIDAAHKLGLYIYISIGEIPS